MVKVGMLEFHPLKKRDLSLEKIIMKKMLALVIVAMGIAGCATTNPTDQVTETAVITTTTEKSDANAKPAAIFVTDEINSTMDNADRAKLQNLVISAKAKQKVSWNSASNSKNQYEFSSQNIYVNDQGNPCRHYSVSASLSSFLHHIDKQANMTACRNDDGVWQLSN